MDIYDEIHSSGNSGGHAKSYHLSALPTTTKQQQQQQKRSTTIRNFGQFHSILGSFVPKTTKFSEENNLSFFVNEHDLIAFFLMDVLNISLYGYMIKI